VRRVRVTSTFGDLSRARLRLLRMELSGADANCDCVARPPDAWDAHLPRKAGERNASMQALKDSIAIRQLLFSTMPNLQSASLRIYRQRTDERMELVITGVLSREAQPPKTVRSLVMRAKLFGFRFWLDEGVLESLESEDYAVNA